MIGFELGHYALVRSVENALEQEVLISREMGEAMALWERLYKDRAPWKNEDVKSLNVAAAVAGELACQATLDFQSRLSGSRRAEMMDKEVYQDVIFDVRRFAEYACANGGLVFKPYLDKNRLAVEYVRANRFFPLEVDSRGKIISAAFIEQLKHDRRPYTRLEVHRLTEEGVSVQNLAFCGGVLGLGRPVPLEDVPEWADLAGNVTIEGAKKPLFAYFKMPMANTIDPDSPLGVSVYSRAVELIREADMQFSRLIWEYEGGELAVDASVDALMLENGDMKMPKLNRRLFRGLDIDMGGSDLYSVFAPALRDTSYKDGLNEILIRIEDACGLARGTISSVNNSARTATELKILRQRSYSTVTDIQKSLQMALTDLVDGLDMVATAFDLLPPGEEHTVVFEFDDSAITDRQTQFEEMQVLVSQGIMDKWEFRTWYLGETEEQAREKLAKMQAERQKEAGHAAEEEAPLG